MAGSWPAGRDLALPWPERLDRPESGRSGRGRARMGGSGWKTKKKKKEKEKEKKTW
jgi:hypothetical protein